MNIFKNLAVMFIAAIMLIACGGDNGSSAKDDEIDSSSSGVILSDSEESSSSVVKSSSSAKESSSSSEARSSSSSAKSSSSSDVILSGGSAAVEESSSSAKSSSSSAKSSSSSAKSSSSSVKSSSSSAKSSSSSVKVSSSSRVYVPFDHSVTLAGVFEVGKDAYKQFTDERNGRSYYYITIAGKDTSGNDNSVTVMAENLNVGDFVWGFLDQEEDSKIERYCYDDDTTKCDRYGGLYQWAEMMALPSECNTKSCADLIKEKHQGICPTGWRLQTYNEMYTIVNADGNNHGIEGVRSAHKFGGYNTTGYSLVGAGYLFDYQFKNLSTGTYWFYPEERTEKRTNASWADNSSSVFQKVSINKSHGFSVRCVMVE